MPIWADPKRGETIRLLADDDMTLLATFVAPPGTRPTASDMRMVEGTDPERFARIAVRDLPGVRIVTRVDEAAALADVGATVVSTAAHVVRDGLQDRPPPLEWIAPPLPPALTITGIDRDATELAGPRLDAYPPGHPDRDAVLEAHATGAFASLLAGEVMGPVYEDASALAVDREGRVVGAVIVTVWERIGDEWPGGPWVSELFRAPDVVPGLGRGLLQRAVAVAHLDGHDAIGLTANPANPAASLLYPQLGFELRFHRVTLDLPGSWPA